MSTSFSWLSLVSMVMLAASTPLAIAQEAAPKKSKAPVEVPDSWSTHGSQALPDLKDIPVPRPLPLPFTPFGARPQKIFDFHIDPKTPLKDLLPEQPTQSSATDFLNEDLAKVPELMFSEPMSKELSDDEAMETIARMTAKIHHLNDQSQDLYMRELAARRLDLRGLPFRFGTDCRTDAVDSELSQSVGNFVRLSMDFGGVGKSYSWQFLPKVFEKKDGTYKFIRPENARQKDVDKAAVATLMQVIATESNLHTPGFPKFLSQIHHVDATRALAKLVLYSPDAKVRAGAIAALQSRPSKDYADILVDGFRYPLPVVAQRAAEALVQLKCKDTLTQLVAVLDRPDPRLPQQSDDNDAWVVREVVRVNHHRNCLLCHAPANAQVPFTVQRGRIPLPGSPFPTTPEYYQNFASPDILVRIDVTYLRQDFSLMMPVEKADPWPTMQRFDFLVRSRPLTANEAKAYDGKLGRRSPYHQAAASALRDLTGHNAELAPSAWRKYLGLPERNVETLPQRQLAVAHPSKTRS